MINKNEANKAIAQLDGYSVDGNNIRVEVSFQFKFRNSWKVKCQHVRAGLDESACQRTEF